MIQNAKSADYAEIDWVPRFGIGIDEGDMGGEQDRTWQLTGE